MKSFVPNQILQELPALADPFLIYREAPWIEYLFRAMALVAGSVAMYFGLFAFQSIGGISQMAFLVLAATLVLAGAYPRHPDQATRFVCDARGLYFPSSGKSPQQSTIWLFVPWANLLDYKLRLLLDETSTLGLVLSIAVAETDVRMFFSRLHILGLHRGHADPAWCTVDIAFTSFSPQPRDVLQLLRKLHVAHWQAPSSQLVADGALPGPMTAM